MYIYCIRPQINKQNKQTCLEKRALQFPLLQQFSLLLNTCGYTPNANMADHSVVARDELHESEVSQCSMFC